MSEQPGSLGEALAALQAALPRVTKDATAQYGKYADLAAITDALLPAMAALGLYWTCSPTIREDGQFVLHYMLSHRSSLGVIAGDYPLASTGGPQALGSAITYARRYALCAVTGLAPAGDDDDAQATAIATAGTAWRPPAHPSTRKADRHRAGRDGPLPDDQWTTGAEDQPGSISDAQVRRMVILFGQLGRGAREDRLALTSELLSLQEPVGSSRDLSFRQAEELCRKLEDMTRKEKAGG